MKTGGTLNFLKRAGAILMLVAVFASSCNKYADDFKQLNTKLDGLASSIGAMSTLSADVAGVKASVASVLAAVNAIPNPTASITKLQSDLTAAAAAIATINTNLTSLTTVVNGLPKLADVNGIATKVAADLTTQLAKLNADIAAAIKANNTTLTSAFTAAIAANNATLDALVKGDLVANNAAISAAITANNAAISAAIAANNKAISDAIVANNAAITAAEAAALVANNAAIVKAITDNNPAIAALIAANNAAVNTAIVGNNTAMAVLIQAQIDALKVALAGSSTDALTAATINALAAQLAAMKVTLGVIYTNTIKVVTVPTITGTAQVGMTLTANLGTSLETGTWQWMNCATVGGTYAPIITDATNATYLVKPGDLGKFIKVVITGTGSYFGPSATASTGTSVATAAVTDMVALTGIAAISPTTPAVGVKLTAGSLQSGVVPTNDALATATYTWMSSATQFGTYAPISGSGSAKTYTLAATDNTMWIKVVATGTGAYFNTVTSGAIGPVAATDLLAPAISFVTSNNFVTINLTNATFAATLTPANFSFTGSGDPTNNWANAFVTRKSDTQATVQLQGANVFVDGTSDIIGVKANALATYGTGASASAAASTVVALLPVCGTTIGGFVLPVAGAVPVTSSALTVTNATKAISWSPAVSGNFLAGTVYTATITITPSTGYSLNGVLANGLTVTGAVAGGATVTNSANSGVITVVCPVTSAVSPITLTTIAGVTAPVSGTTPITTITSAQYTGTITWSSSAGPLAAGSVFAAGLTYTASITLTPTAGYSVYGVAANAYSVTGAMFSTNAANSQLVAATFPTTLPSVAITNAAIAGVTAPVKAATAVTAITADPQFTGTVTWSPALVGGVFAAATVYTATITLNPIDRIVTGVAANFFTVAGATTVANAINSGVVTAVFPVTAP